VALTIYTETVGDARVCIPDGPIDTPGAEKVSQWVREAFFSGAKILIFDLLKVTYVASAGLGAFMHAMKSFPGKVVFVAPQQYVQQTFRMNGLDRFATICQTHEEALRA
jgi:anti-anti-sigma factor